MNGPLPSPHMRPGFSSKRGAAALALMGMASTIDRHVFAHASEDELQAEIHRLLTEQGYACERERVAVGANGGAHRFDVLVSGGLVVECKIGGSMASAVDQCHRYLQLQEVQGLLLCGPSFWRLASQALARLQEACGKPAVFAPIRRAAF